MLLNICQLNRSHYLLLPLRAKIWLLTTNTQILVPSHVPKCTVARIAWVLNLTLVLCVCSYNENTVIGCYVSNKLEEKQCQCIHILSPQLFHTTSRAQHWESKYNFKYFRSIAFLIQTDHSINKICEISFSLGIYIWANTARSANSIHTNLLNTRFS